VKESRSQIGFLSGFLAGTGTIIFLGFFSRKAIRQACLARGWRVSDQTIRQG